METCNRVRRKGGVAKKNYGIVTLIADFGLQGEYSGAMKGVILKINPACRVIDVTHRIAPQNVVQAAFVLKNIYPYYPGGTVHVVVVDPGVGTKRRAIILKKGAQFFVGPDNGVFTLVLSAEGKTEGYEITRKEFFLSPFSSTFQGRDLFAPVAGHLSLGKDPKKFGPRAENFIKIKWPQPEFRGNKLLGRILWADAFGNLIMNISRQEYGPLIEGKPIRISGQGWRIDRVYRTYGEVQPGRPMALFGSSEMLEIAVNQGSARKALGLKPGDIIKIEVSG